MGLASGKFPRSTHSKADYTTFPLAQWWSSGQAHLDSLSLWSFSTKSAWQMLRTPHLKVDWYKLVWFPGNIPKAGFLLWLAIRKRLGTQDRIHNPIPTVCLFCSFQVESHEHLFFDCPLTKQVWSSVLSKCTRTPRTMPWLDLISWAVKFWKGKMLAMKVNKLALAATIYMISMDRIIVFIPIVTVMLIIWSEESQILSGVELWATPTLWTMIRIGGS